MFSQFKINHLDIFEVQISFEPDATVAREKGRLSSEPLSIFSSLLIVAVCLLTTNVDLLGPEACVQKYALVPRS